MKSIIVCSILMLFASTSMSLAQDLDPYTYPVTENGEQLKNVFLKSSFLNSGGPLFINGVAGGEARGFVEKNGKLYFSSRKSNNSPYNAQVFEVDGATGSLLNTYDLPNELYSGLTFPANDIAIDNAGNIFISNMVTTTGEFRITYIDPDKSPLQWETVLSATLSGRYETFEVFGDIKNGDGFILVPKSSSNIIYKYNVTNGTANATAEEIKISQFFPDPVQAKASITGFGQSPRLHIVSNDYFYADGTHRYPVRYNMAGMAVDGFQNNVALAPTSMEPKPERADGDDKRGGANGVTEFELNGKHYLIVASANTDFVTPQQFDLFQFKDDKKEFGDMTFLYRFPNAGMGKQSNGIVSISNVQILNNGTEDKARIYIYAYKNGYGIYDLITNVIEESSEFDWLQAPAIVVDDSTAKVVGPNADSFTRFYVNGAEVALTDGKADLSGLAGDISLKATTNSDGQVIRLKIRR
ncbi:hypothetical protein HMPREF1214_00316 [Bacteroides sp. HPS0048]|uniref:rhamnogalacturonan lyase domain-containing protein n=1 Tax=Bacteroides sp. HPS0048 TaxID=1078089 RepID=UPI0003791A84|nr:DUF4990 domain-containing protein [Bacteroides sp. HPS0048]EOA60471.1 hypothetical protein HMPREF1214_00316 [Bacteroides sp. HPS0048]